MQYIKFLSIGLFSALCLSSCENVDDLIKKSLKDDSTISKEEFTAIQDKLKGKDADAVKAYILEVAEKLCANKRSKITCPITIQIEGQNTDSSSTLTNNQLIFDFFYENSGSMHGYICPNAIIASAIQDMMIKAEDGGKAKVNMYYINDKIYPLDSNTPFSDFIGKATKDKKYEAKSSPIDNIIRQAIDNALQNSNKISFLISDYEYAAGKDNVERTLHEVERHMNKLNENGYATLVAKFETQFNKSEKPIYIWAFAKAEKLIEATKKLNLVNQRGYKNHVILLGLNSKINPYYSILNYTEKEGRFELVDRSNEIIKDIKEITFSRENRFSFSFVADLSKLPLDNVDICNMSNYSISGTTSNFKIEKITPIKEMSINHNDKSKLKNATHIFKITLIDKLEKGNIPLSIHLNKSLPEWAKNNTSSDIKALLDATTNAYHYNDNKNTFITFNLNIIN